MMDHTAVSKNFTVTLLLRNRAVVARQAHNLKVVGSNPTSASSIARIAAIGDAPELGVTAWRDTHYRFSLPTIEATKTGNDAAKLVVTAGRDRTFRISPEPLIMDRNLVAGQGMPSARDDCGITSSAVLLLARSQFHGIWWLTRLFRSCRDGASPASIVGCFSSNPPLVVVRRPCGACFFPCVAMSGIGVFYKPTACLAADSTQPADARLRNTWLVPTLAMHCSGGSGRRFFSESVAGCF